MIRQGQFLGSGGSMGVPLAGCSCTVCAGSDPKNRRLRPSYFFSINGKNVLIDVSPDFRQQALNFGIKKIDAVFLSHTHFDHAGGLVDLRIFAYLQKAPIPIYCTSDSHKDLQMRFDYLFSLSGTPIIKTKILDSSPGEFTFEGQLVEYFHYSQMGMKVTGFKLGSFAYMTDMFDFDETIYAFLKGVKTLVISARNEEKTLPHKKAHLTVKEALAFGKRAGAEKLYLNHLSHDVNHSLDEKTLPPFAHFAFDGLKLDM